MFKIKTETIGNCFPRDSPNIMPFVIVFDCLSRNESKTTLLKTHKTSDTKLRGTKPKLT